MQLILAIDSDPRRCEQLANLVRARFTVELVQATSAGEGLHALRDRVPDLILTAPLLSPFDDGVLDEYLRDLGGAATHVQTVRIPMLSAAPKKKSSARSLFGLGRTKKPTTSSAAPDGCDPKVFADEIAHYLTRSLEERAASAQSATNKSAAAEAPAPVRRSERDAVWQPDEEFVPQALVEQFTEPVNHVPAPIQAAPIVEEEMVVPGAIFNLRPTPVVRAPEVIVEPEPPAVVEPEPYVFAQPEPYVFAEPEPYVFVQTEPEAFVEPEPLVLAEPELEPLVLAERDAPVFVEPAPVYVEPAVPAIVEPVVKLSAPTTTPAPVTPAGTSSSFEAALAAIRAAWVKPEATPVVAPPSAPAGGRPKPVAGSAEVDLTNQIDALEDVVGVEAPAADDEHSPDTSKTSIDRHKADKGIKRPEKARGRKTRGPDGRDDLGVFDPKQCDFAALVNKLDEVTEDEVTGHPTTNVR